MRPALITHVQQINVYFWHCTFFSNLKIKNLSSLGISTLLWWRVCVFYVCFFRHCCIPHLRSLITFLFGLVFDSMYMQLSATRLSQSLQNVIAIEFVIPCCSLLFLQLWILLFTDLNSQKYEAEFWVYFI